MVNKEIFTYIPFPRLLPLATLHRRTILKWIWIGSNVSRKISALFNLSGAKLVGITVNGAGLMRLNRNYALGSKGSIVEVPLDDLIFNKIRFEGSYDLEESYFLCKGLKAGSALGGKVALIDIGANIGLVSLQAMNLARSNADVFCFEPNPENVTTLRNNMQILSKSVKVNIQNFGLSDKDGVTRIFTEKTNRGNSSVFESVVPERGRTQSDIQLVDTKAYFEKNLTVYTSFIIKSDTQGMDAKILSRIPGLIWQNTICAEIEVWALQEIDSFDVDTLLQMVGKFELKSWSPTGIEKLEVEDIRAFWLGKTGTWRNLYLSRSS
jgi:FkbM family methyltransferase